MKQYASPIYVKNEESKKVLSIETDKMIFSEEYIQDICYCHPSILPVDEIEQIYTGLIPLCRELPMPSGYCDVAFINEEGLITLVECKLWKNPEGRRKVIGQILDYAKDLSKWNYEVFEKQCLTARHGDENSIIEIIRKYSPDINESVFIDSVTKNIKRGRFLLLIVGDGIRENMEEMVGFVNHYGNLSFTLSLVELPIYMINGTEEVIITPRVLVKTTEVIRDIIEHEKNKITLKEQKEIVISSSISELEYFSRLEKVMGTDTTNKFKDLLIELKNELFLITKLGRGKRLSLNIKTEDGLNFASIQENGEVLFYGIIGKTEELGDRSIGDHYLRSMISILGADKDYNYVVWQWNMKKDGKYINIKDLIEKKELWKNIIEETLKSISDLKE